MRLGLDNFDGSERHPVKGVLLSEAKPDEREN